MDRKEIKGKMIKTSETRNAQRKSKIIINMALFVIQIT